MPGLHDVLWWLLAIGIVVASVQLFWFAVTPVSPLGNWKPARVSLMDESARSALMTGFDPFNRNVAVVAGPGTNVAIITDLPLTVFGIRFNPATGGGTAIIAGADGQQMVYRIGEQVMEGVTLAGVAFDHVTLSRNGNSELLYLDQSKPAPVAAPDAAPAVPVPAPAPAVVPPPPSPTSGISASSLQQGVGFAPTGGGIAVSARGDGAAFRNAGLRSGDVLVSVNGKAVSGQGDIASIAGQARPGSTLSMTVRRNGREVPLNILVSK